MAYTVHWLRKHEEEQWEQLGRLLGTIWYREDILSFVAGKKDEGKPVNKLFLPLSTILKPQLVDVLKKMMGSIGQPVGGGDYIPTEGEQIVEMGEMDRQTFKNIIAGAMGGIKR